jgi:biotin-dependent carboxylase-like uncharacterized protein
MSELHVLEPGVFTTSQDLGRSGRAHLGVPRSGAADRASLRRANRLVGNSSGAAAWEVLLGGLRVEARGDVVLAVTGATVTVEVDDVLQGRDVALSLVKGQQLRIGRPTHGLRSYVAVRGGVDAAVVLGSRSYEQLGAIGPAPLRAGDIVRTGVDTAGPVYWSQVPSPEIPVQPALRFLPGTRADWLTDEAALLASSWTVAASSDRTGTRLVGPPLARRAGELASEGLLPGAVQVPADGQPIILGPDAGVTGGYPVVAVVVDADLDLLGQLAPGVTVKFQRA